MPTENKPWIFTRSCEFSPTGNLALGQILAEPRNPAHVLQPLGPLPLHEGIKPEETSRENVNMQSRDELSAHFSAWANLGYIPVRLNASGGASSSHEYTWHFDKLESRIISPTLAYVRAAMRHGDVEESLSGWSWRQRVYMVTGVRVVSGARMKSLNSSSSNIKGAAGGPLPDQSASVGADAAVERKASTEEDFENASDFVFAYRLNEVRYRGKVTHKPYTGGETASADKKKAPTDEVVVNDFEVLKINQEAFGGNKEGFERVDVPGFEELECFVGKE